MWVREILAIKEGTKDRTQFLLFEQTRKGFVWFVGEQCGSGFSLLQTRKILPCGRKIGIKAQGSRIMQQASCRRSGNFSISARQPSPTRTQGIASPVLNGRGATSPQIKRPGEFRGGFIADFSCAEVRTSAAAGVAATGSGR